MRELFKGKRIDEFGFLTHWMS